MVFSRQGRRCEFSEGRDPSYFAHVLSGYQSQIPADAQAIIVVWMVDRIREIGR